MASGATPVDAWRRLREVEGPHATVIDLYELVATPRGLAPHELPHAERIRLARSVMPDVWPGFAQTEASERLGDTIQIVDYDPGWPRQYGKWHAALQSCLGDTATRIEHVGSTSVPGLPAKPIVDIQVSVAELADESRYVPQLEGIGFQLRSRDDVHRYFRPFPSQPRDVHVHLCAAGSEWEREHLLFRDYLRTHDQACKEYSLVKRHAAATWFDDGIAYTDAKSELILTLLDAAKDWSSDSASHVHDQDSEALAHKITNDRG
ncbi:MAG: hypothetical protein QOG99_500 [Frankiales bacterium]|nr:hypothetical protein [Frankiales bacterium]